MVPLDKVVPPVGILLGSPREVADLVRMLGQPDITCYQMDVYQAEQVQRLLAEEGQQARVVTAPDVWDLPAGFHTLIYPVPLRGERGLKIDIIEQAHHILRPSGKLIAASPYESDSLLPAQLKKVFGKVHNIQGPSGVTFWAAKQEERPRRRHEMTFHVQNPAGPSFVFVSRPGTFAYGRFDDGARALIETMEIKPGERILDLGCGCGTNGTIAGQRSGGRGQVTFVDSNVRAVALAEMNARANGLTAIEAVASANVTGFTATDFDVILANPPYYAQHSIAELFIHRSAELLKRGGRLYLVTKQIEPIAEMFQETFQDVEADQRRNYTILIGHK